MIILFYIWILIFILCVIFELISPGFFFFLSLALGSLSGAISTLIFDNSYIHCAIFVAATLFSLIILKAWIKNSSKDTLHKTNAYSLIGKRALIVSELSKDTKGWVEINGEFWSAYANESNYLYPGTYVEIVAIVGSHLIVKKID